MSDDVDNRGDVATWADVSRSYAYLDEKKRGPHVTVSANCYGCEYCVNDRADEKAITVFCVQAGTNNGKSPGRRIGTNTWATPEWCPFLDGEVIAAALEIIAKTRKDAGK